MKVVLPFAASDLDQFIHNCLATDCSYDAPCVHRARIEHAVIGMLTELPEFANAHLRLVKILDLLEDHGGSPMDIPWFEGCVVNLLEEFGDIQWYGALFAEGCAGVIGQRPNILCEGEEQEAPVFGTAAIAKGRFTAAYERLTEEGGLDLLKKLKFYDKWNTSSGKGLVRFDELMKSMLSLQDAICSETAFLMQAFQGNHVAHIPRDNWLRKTQNWAHKARVMVSYKLITSRYNGEFHQDRANLRDVRTEQELMLRILRDTSL